MQNPMVLYGATGHAAAVREEIETVYAARKLKIIAYIDDNAAPGQHAPDGVPVIDFAYWAAHHRGAPVVVCIGAPVHRRRLAARIAQAGGRFETLVGGWPSVARDVAAGAGSFVGGGAYVGPRVRIGDHVQIQPLSCIGHDTTVGDYTTISTARIAGCVEIGSDVYIGIGAVIVHGSPARKLHIGDGAFIAAGSVVTKSVPPGAKVMGNPARPVRELIRSLRSGAGG